MIPTVKNLLYFFIITLMLSTACQKDEAFFPNSNTDVAGHKIAGKVVDESGNPVEGATVISADKSAVTGKFGQFVLTNVNVSDNRIVVKCAHNGYYTGTATEIPSSTGSTFVQITLQKAIVTETISSSAGGEATLANGSSVEIPGNAIVDKNGNAYNGDVFVSVAHLDPTDPKFGQLIQGSDMQAIETDGEKVTLYSYGILRVELGDGAGNELQLASGKEATITMLIPATMVATAPSSIPLWYFDETDGIWKEEGKAIKVGNEYIGTVKHFTDWNCDYPSSGQATITGTILDCNNSPVPNVYVRTGQTYAWTDANGKFSRRVPSGVDMSCKVESTNNGGLSSDAYNFASLSDGQEHSLGRIILVTCPSYLVGTITDCYGKPISGWVNINTSSTGDFIYASNGSFKIRVATNTDVTVTAYTDAGGLKNASMTTSANMGDVNDLGYIKICSSVSLGENGFTINGDGFNNQKVIIDIPNFVYSPSTNDKEFAVGSISDSNSFILGDEKLEVSTSGTNNLNNSSYPLGKVSISLIGTSIGTYSLGSYSIVITLKEHTYSWEDDYISASGTISITRLDSQGGLIEGRYSGTFYKTDDTNHSNPITITNGRFSVVRLADKTYF